MFFYLTYYGSVDVASIDDESLREATELQIAHFGQCPMQCKVITRSCHNYSYEKLTYAKTHGPFDSSLLSFTSVFYRRHAKKQARGSRRRRRTISECLRLFDVKTLPLNGRSPIAKITSENSEKEEYATKKTLPFIDAPMAYWVHLGAPPPGPHAPLISVRLALADRCLAVDSKGIFHFFRWAWKPELVDDDLSEDNANTTDENVSPDDIDLFLDKGCFVAQRELFSFRNIPRLPYAPMATENARHVTVGLSKTLFANRSLLLVLSDGDGKGGLAMQLVDPVKGAIRGEVIVPSAHADYITSIDMDPIGKNIHSSLNPSWF